MEGYFRALCGRFSGIFFPQAYAEIDWLRGYTFLDKELQQVVQDAELGRRYADKLVQVWRNDGDETWVLIRIEVQSQEEAGFAQRMFVYYYRLLDRFNRQIASMAVLGDERANWRPAEYTSTLWGCDLQFRFPIVKSVDYLPRWSELEASRNPFATVVMAHPSTIETRRNADQRKHAKLVLTRRLYQLGYTREAIIDLFRFIDWLMRLPDDLERSFWQEVQQYEEEQHVTYVTSVERIGIEKGLEQGRLEGFAQGRQEGRQEGLRAGLLAAITLGVELRFGAVGTSFIADLRRTDDLAVFQRVYDGIKEAASLDTLRGLAPVPATDL